MNRPASWIAVLYVALLLVGRASLPLHAQWGDLLFPLLLLAVWSSPPRPRWGGRRDWPLAAYLAVTLGAALVSSDPPTGLGQLLKGCYVAFIFLAFRRMTKDEALTARLGRTLVIAATLVAAASMVVVFLRFPPSIPLRALGATDVLPFFGRVGRLRGLLLTPEMLGEFFVVAFPLALALRSTAHGRARIVWAGAAALLAIGEVLTVSHSVAGFVVAAVLFAAADGWSRVARALAWSAAFSVFALVNAASVVDFGNEPNDYGVAPFSFERGGTRIAGTLNHYFALKQVAWGAFVRHPLIGVGPGRFPEETERAFQEGRLPARYRDKVPQCDPAGRLAETGALGLASLLGLWGSWVAGIASRFREGPALERAAGAAVVGLLVNSLNADVMNFRFLWVALAWALPADDSSTPGAATAEAAEPRLD